MLVIMCFGNWMYVGNLCKFVIICAGICMYVGNYMNFGNYVWVGNYQAIISVAKFHGFYYHNSNF